jgi:DNA-binding IclR family transcriptional regulator
MGVIDSVVGVAAPIRNHLDKVIAAVGIRFISSSVGNKRKKQLITHGCERGRGISAGLGYQPE